MGRIVTTHYLEYQVYIKARPTRVLLISSRHSYDQDCDDWCNMFCLMYTSMYITWYHITRMHIPHTNDIRIHTCVYYEYDQRNVKQDPQSTFSFESTIN